MKYISKDEALAKLQRYCAYQDRCHQEVRSKLLDLGIRGHDLEEIMADLIIEKFLDEERYARSFVRGKYRIKKWGRTKIRQGLKQKNISAYCMKMGFSEIEEDVYYNNLVSILEKKAPLTKASNSYQRNAKLAKFAIQKGYEPYLVWEVVKDKFGNSSDNK